MHNFDIKLLSLRLLKELYWYIQVILYLLSGTSHSQRYFLNFYQL